MSIWKGLLFLGGYTSVAMAQAEMAREEMAPPSTPKEVVSDFLHNVRSGAHPDWAPRYLARRVTAHQMNSEAPQDVMRTPDDYARHVQEFRQAYGDFRFEVTELLADGDRVYARWRQTGCQIGTVDGVPPTHRPVAEVASAVYRVEAGRIVEYWIQIDRQGTALQLQANAASTALPRCA